MRLALEQPRQIRTLPVEGVAGQLSANLGHDAAGGLAIAELVRQVALGRLPRGSACVPGAQRRQGSGVREAFWRGQVSGHVDESGFRTEMIVQG